MKIGRYKSREKSVSLMSPATIQEKLESSSTRKRDKQKLRNELVKRGL